MFSANIKLDLALDLLEVGVFRAYNVGEKRAILNICMYELSRVSTVLRNIILKMILNQNHALKIYTVPQKDPRHY